MGWQWHQLDHTQIICISFQTGNHASTSSLNFLHAGCSFWRPTSSVKALKAEQSADNRNVFHRWQKPAAPWDGLCNYFSSEFHITPQQHHVHNGLVTSRPKSRVSRAFESSSERSCSWSVVTGQRSCSDLSSKLQSWSWDQLTRSGPQGKDLGSKFRGQNKDLIRRHSAYDC